MTEPAGIDETIQRFPIGDHVSGRVERAIQSAGLFVDLGPGTYAFVDGEHLCGRENWPPIGTLTEFEVLRHDIVRHSSGTRRCQVRLWPLEQRWRNPRSTHWGFDDGQWAAIESRYPVGAVVTGTVSRINSGNRWYTVHFDDVWARVTWTGGPPAAGTTSRYTVTRLLDSTHRILVTPENA